MEIFNSFDVPRAVEQSGRATLSQPAYAEESV